MNIGIVFEQVVGRFVWEKFGCYFKDVGCGIELYMEVFSLVYYFLVNLCVGVVFKGCVWCVVILFFDMERELEQMMSFYFVLFCEYLIDVVVLNLEKVLGLVGFCCGCDSFSFLVSVVSSQVGYVYNRDVKVWVFQVFGVWVWLVVMV